MAWFEKRPVRVEATQFTGENWVEMREFTGSRLVDNWIISNFAPADSYLVTEDPEVTAEVWDKLHSSWVGVKDGQWIIRGLEGEFYPCDSDVFERSYRKVGD